MANFAQFHRTSGRRVQNPDPVLTIGSDGKFQLNVAAWALLSEPRAVQLFFSEEDDMIGIRPVTEGNPDAYAVVNADKQNYKKVISATSFCAHYKIDTEETSQYSVVFSEDEGMGIVDINKPLVYSN